MSEVPAPPEGLRTTSAVDPNATRIILVRHGQGVVNVSGVIGGPVGCVGLSDLGRAQVGGMAARLAKSGELNDVDLLMSSILPRARQTAEILAPALGLSANDIIEDCDVCELHPGEADGLIWEEYAKRYEVPDWDSDPTMPLSPGGEDWASFVDRAGAALDRLASEHQGKRIVVATHAGFIESTIIRHLVGSERGSRHPRLRLQTKHASLTEWERSPLGWRMQRYNDAVGTETAS